MRNRSQRGSASPSERGNASVEFALFLPFLAGLFMLVVEGGMALKTYYSLLEVSREGARIMLRDGNPALIPPLLKALGPQLDLTKLKAQVVMDQGAGLVSVELDYEWPAFFGSASGTDSAANSVKAGDAQQTIKEVDNDTKQYFFQFTGYADVMVPNQEPGDGLGFASDWLLMRAKTTMPLP